VFVPKDSKAGAGRHADRDLGRGLDKAGNISAFLIGGPNPGGFAVNAPRTTSATPRSCRAATCCCWNGSSAGPAGSLSASGALRLESQAGRRGRRADPVRADLGYEIDNMEGLSVHRNAGGEIVLTLVSDDNFSMIQRTLLLQFTWLEP
jgi:hypothetical protein